MGEELVVLPLQFVVNTAAFLIGEQSESSLRFPLVSEGITADEDSLVNAMVDAIGTSRVGRDLFVALEY
jgi:hypothetical protein